MNHHTCIPEFHQYLEAWDQDLELLRQNRLLDEAALIRFARDRGIPVFGVVTGDPGNLCRQGLLTADGLDDKDSPLFHPFRIYPLLKNLEASRRRARTIAGVEQALALAEAIESLQHGAQDENRVAELAILLEPIYWPRVTGMRVHRGTVSEHDFESLLGQYREKVLSLVKTLDPKRWLEVHESLRFDAARLDENDALYLLLRLATWKQREELKGAVSGALWIRHIAEVIRRGFEEVHGERWLEEDQAFGTWFSGGRTIAFGSERPLDDALQARPYLSWNYGLFTGSAVRWYVEGETEYYAILHILPEPSQVGIELENLRGAIASNRGNAALTLRDRLKEDKKFRRFSVISFDRDVPANVKVIRRHVEQHHVVGFIAAHRPDFEFANFTVQELAEVAAGIDEKEGFSADAVRNADWTGVNNGRAFEEKYKEVSARRPVGLKGEQWGRALAAYMEEHPNRSNDGSERPFWREIRAALMGRIAHYNIQKERYRFDPDTFELTDISGTDVPQRAEERVTTPRQAGSSAEP